VNQRFRGGLCPFRPDDHSRRVNQDDVCRVESGLIDAEREIAMGRSAPATVRRNWSSWRASPLRAQEQDGLYQFVAELIECRSGMLNRIDIQIYFTCFIKSSMFDGVVVRQPLSPESIHIGPAR